MIPEDAVNVRTLEISRPNRSGPASDEVGAPTVLHENLCAIVTFVERTTRGADGREHSITAQIDVDPCDCEGDPIECRLGDFLSWTDWNGKRLRRQMVLRVKPHYVGAELNHLRIEVGG